MLSTAPKAVGAPGGFVGFEGFTDRRSARKCFAWVQSWGVAGGLGWSRVLLPAARLWPSGSGAQGCGGRWWVWWVLRGFFPTKREQVENRRAGLKLRVPDAEVGFVGFEGFTDCPSARKFFCVAFEKRAELRC